MRIKNLVADRFVAIQHAAVEFRHPMAIIFGNNGSGKSSIIDAIRAGLTGTARGVAKKDAATLSRIGGKGWKIELKIQSGEAGGHIRRTTSGLAAINADGDRVDLSEGSLRTGLRLDTEVIDAVFDVWSALDMTNNERRSLLCRLTGINANEEGLRASGLTDATAIQLAVAGEWGRAKRDLTERRRALQRTPTSVAVIEDIPIPNMDGWTASMVEDETLKKWIDGVAKLEKSKRDLYLAIGAAGAEQVVSGYEDLKAKIDGINVPALEAELRKEQDEVMPIRETLSAALDGLEELNRKFKDRMNIVDQLQEKLRRDEARSGTHACPICDMQHDSPEGYSTARLDEIQKSIDAAESDINDLRLEIESGKEFCEFHRAAVKEATDRIMKLKAKIEAAGDLTAEMATAKPGASEPTGKPLADLQDALKEVERALVVGGTAIETVDRYRASMKVQKGEAERAGKIAADIESLRVQEALCAPDGIRATMAGPAVALVNETAAKLSASIFPEGFNANDVVGVILGDDFDVRVVTKTGEEWNPDTFNVSVRWRAGLVLAVAMAKISGLRFLPVDEVAGLDRDNLMLMLIALRDLGADGYLDQILVCLPDEIPIDITSMDVILMDGGKAERQ